MERTDEKGDNRNRERQGEKKRDTHYRQERKKG